MAAAYELLPLAQDDLFAIWLYLAEEASLEVAEDLEGRFYQAFELLARQPYSGHRREDLTALPLRFWGVPPYLILYRPEPSPLTIVRVLHGKRDLPRILANE